MTADVIRTAVCAILLAGCIELGISRDRAIEIGVAEASLDEVTSVSAVRQPHTNPNGGEQAIVWVVTVQGTSDGCVPGGGGCRVRQAESTYYIDVDTGEVIDGLIQLGPRQ
jgi:hypothetical protein